MTVCPECGEEHTLYHSCRDRHCPRCQYAQREAWLLSRKEELLPIVYFHAVFTVPDVLNPFIFSHQEEAYAALFHAAWDTLDAFGRKAGVQLGMTALLHTWGGNLVFHPHLHCIVPGGGRALSTERWKALPQVKDGEKVLSDADYDIVWADDCVGAGVHELTVILKGNYAGTETETFTILPGKTSRGDMFNLAGNVKVTWKEVPGAKYYKVYREGLTDPEESLEEPVIVTERLIGWDKQPGLTNGNAYRYRIVASLTGRDDPSGDSTLSYSKVMYRLKTVVIRSVKNTEPGKVTVKYDKTTSGDSYVLQYGEREDMVGAKTKVVLGADNTSYVIGGLTKGKTYYVSIRVRKKVDGIDYYTTFGVPKKVTITK